MLLFVDDLVMIGDREGDVLEFKKELDPLLRFTPTGFVVLSW